MQLRRRFVQVGSRRVHYLRAGDGPPAILVHSSPANARLLMKEIAFLSNQFTIFAFDTPGFGLSDPLPLQQLEVADIADAFADTLSAVGIPRCPIFGTHTGAAIVLELGVRHPERATGLVLDGVPAFTSAECKEFFGTYFRSMPVSELGGHYAEAWTRFRDQSIWFPWTNRTPANLNPYDLATPNSTHAWVSMFFEAGDHYAPAYRAASFYGDKAIEAARSLTLPAVFCALETDMLHPHLERLPQLRDGQAIVPIGSSLQRKRELIAESFERFGAEGRAPPDRNSIESRCGMGRQFLDGPAGQMHVRYCGDQSARPLLLLHDAPGSAEQHEGLIANLAEDFFVIAPDLPGCGESDAFQAEPQLATFADAAGWIIDRLGIPAAIIYGIGFGSSLALAVAERHPERVSGLALHGLPLPDAQERGLLREHLAPPINIEADGSHWYRTWLMLRDSLVYWPWFDRRYAATRRTEATFDAKSLHRWTMDVMRARTTYGDVIRAVLDSDVTAALISIEIPVACVVGPETPLSIYDRELQSLCPESPVIDSRCADFASALAEAFQRSE